MRFTRVNISSREQGNEPNRVKRMFHSAELPLSQPSKVRMEMFLKLKHASLSHQSMNGTEKKVCKNESQMDENEKGADMDCGVL